jgi:hypothetical protein
LSAALAFGLASAANAAMTSAPVVRGDPAIVKAAEHCGAGMWRGPHGHCHAFEGPGGPNRGTEFACPPGYHIGAIHDRCFPD